MRVFCGKPASEGPPSLGGFDSICGGLLDGYYSIYNFNVSPPNLRQAVLIKVLNSINYMNKDLAAVSAVWRALHGVRSRRFYCLSRTYRLLVKEPPKMVLRRMIGPSLETGALLDAVLSVNYCAIAIACLRLPSHLFVTKKGRPPSCPGADLTEALLRFQCEDRTEANREAELHTA